MKGNAQRRMAGGAKRLRGAPGAGKGRGEGGGGNCGEGEGGEGKGGEGEGGEGEGGKGEDGRQRTFWLHRRDSGRDPSPLSGADVEFPWTGAHVPFAAPHSLQGSSEPGGGTSSLR